MLKNKRMKIKFSPSNFDMFSDFLKSKKTFMVVIFFKMI